jgi:hypothetical protein
MLEEAEIISARVAPAIMEMIECVLKLSGATRLTAICGGGSKRTATNTTTV